MLLVGGDARPEMIERLLDKADREYTASSRQISPALYGLDDGGNVVPYLRPGTDALARKVRLAHERLAATEYRIQKEALDRADEANESDVFVASYTAIENDDGTITSSALWSRTVDTYLPRTDRVRLATLTPENRIAAFALVPFDAIADRLRLVPGLCPERYETGAFPDDVELRPLSS